MSNQLVTEFENILCAAAPRLMVLSEAESGNRPRPGEWSAKEILGHLIDSACNNHQRFVTAQLTPDLVFPGYAQDDWVALQRYQEAEWADNLHRLAWRPVPESEQVTLEYFIRDYISHLKHHLDQIFDHCGKTES